MGLRNYTGQDKGRRRTRVGEATQRKENKDKLSEPRESEAEELQWPGRGRKRVAGLSGRGSEGIQLSSRRQHARQHQGLSRNLRRRALGNGKDEEGQEDELLKAHNTRRKPPRSWDFEKLLQEGFRTRKRRRTRTEELPKAHNTTLKPPNTSELETLRQELGF